MSPSSVPAQMRFTSSGDGAIAEITPRCFGFASGVPLYLPTFDGTSHVLRVRSGLICVQLRPPFVVFHIMFAAKKRMCGSAGENAIGCVRSMRYVLPRSAL